jgi:alanyl-tRNA synthetase
VCTDLLFYWFRHVAKTGDIRDFVIIEESGIAKGIRRIIAITGEEARQACLDANEIESKWDQIVKLEGIEKEKGIKSFEVVSFFTLYFLPLFFLFQVETLCAHIVSTLID